MANTWCTAGRNNCHQYNCKDTLYTMPDFAGGVTASTLCVWEPESPCFRKPHAHLWILKIYQFCVHLRIIYLFSMRCLMLTRSNAVSNMLNQYCSPLDDTQKRNLRPTGECSAEHLLRSLCTDWQQRRVCQYKKLLLVLVNFLLPLRTPIHVDHWRRELSCFI